MRGILIENNDLVVSNGTLQIGDVNEQIAQFVVLAYPGEFKHAPLIGGNVRQMQNGTPDPFWAGKIKRQLRQCLVAVKRVSVKTDNIEIELNN